MSGFHKHIEIEITTACDVKCPCCDRFCDTAPSTERMTVQQIGHFVDDSIALDWRWERIHVLGGEPTLHPEFCEIFDELIRYRKTETGTLLRVITNGRGRLGQYQDWLRARGIDIYSNYKDPKHMPAWWRNSWIAPVDSAPDVGLVPPCGIYGARGCGIGFTRYGFFPCGAGASIARVVGLNLGIRDLRELTHEACLEQCKSLCRLCDHASNYYKFLKDTGPTASPFWVEAFGNYKREKPTLPLYPEA